MFESKVSFYKSIVLKELINKELKSFFEEFLI